MIVDVSRQGPADPLRSIDALPDVRFVLEDGVVSQRDGVKTPARLFHGGPVNGGNAR
jgi:hypothetical protein